MIGAAKANKVPVVMTISDGVFWDVFRFQERFIMYNEGLSTSEVNNLWSHPSQCKTASECHWQAT